MEIMRELPIIYSSPMILAKLAGRKTMTRRTRGLEAVNVAPDDWEFDVCGPGQVVANSHRSIFAKFQHKKTGEEVWLRCHYGQPGDVLYAQENLHQQIDGVIRYAADYSQWRDSNGYHYRHEEYEGTIPSIHMPKVAARIWDEVVSIKVERVQDITEEDAIAEGIDFDPICGRWSGGNQREKSAKAHFYNLWTSINGEESWKLNPYVWCVTTKNLSTTGKPSTL